MVGASWASVGRSPLQEKRRSKHRLRRYLCRFAASFVLSIKCSISPGQDLIYETQGLLDKLRGAAVTADSAGPEHFRLFILEDAAQQCLEELQR